MILVNECFVVKILIIGGLAIKIDGSSLGEPIATLIFVEDALLDKFTE